MWSGFGRSSDFHGVEVLIWRALFFQPRASSFSSSCLYRNELFPRHRVLNFLINTTAMASLHPIRRLPTGLIDSMSYRSLASTRCFSQSFRMRATVGLDALDEKKGDRERIIILGSGWAGMLTLDCAKNPFLLIIGVQAMSSPNASRPNIRPSS